MEPTNDKSTAESPVPLSIEVSVVIPCRNEERTLAGCILEALEACKSAGISGEVIVANNGSTDNSQAVAEAHGARVVDVQEVGYGNALRGGIAQARGKFIVMGDADGSYQFCEIPRFVEQLRNGFDLVMGNRFKGGIDPGAMPWLHRYFGNPVLSWIGRRLFRSPIGDFQCGLRAFSRQAYDAMQTTAPGMEFASEIVVRATQMNLRVTEIPIQLKPDGRNGPSHLRTWRDGWRNICLMARLRFQSRRGT
ncbi:MAG: glycosyltransferase family 2 protein [Planctomycetaceae bacterium]|nr:glycosyltransferase family 2 protein [Planctomycetaceae bacterium]